MSDNGVRAGDRTAPYCNPKSCKAQTKDRKNRKAQNKNKNTAFKIQKHRMFGVLIGGIVKALGYRLNPIIP